MNQLEDPNPSLEKMREGERKSVSSMREKGGCEGDGGVGVF